MNLFFRGDRAAVSAAESGFPANRWILTGTARVTDHDKD
jgi:hypothetical protein